MMAGSEGVVKRGVVGIGALAGRRKGGRVGGRGNASRRDSHASGSRMRRRLFGHRDPLWLKGVERELGSVGH